VGDINKRGFEKGFIGAIAWRGFGPAIAEFKTGLGQAC
jgi:hypothetical protein